MPSNRERLAVAATAAALLASVLFSAAAAAQPPRTPPAGTARLERIGEIVQQAIQAGDLPGAVVLVNHRGRTIYREAFGQRSVRPAREPMTADTLFDLASLTKVVATTPSVMALVEDGALRLRDRVAFHLPGFESHGKEAITVEQLLTHVSGLRPDLPLEEEFEGQDEAMLRILDERLEAPPGESFIYSDLNFILLGAIVERLSGRPLDVFARERLFEPMGMHETTFRPPSETAARIAPTEACTPLGWPCGAPGAVMLRGTVHDPTARRMGGVAGHAGLFSTADDLARFGGMLLSRGLAPDGDRAVLSPLTIERMTRSSTPPALPVRRGLGWDIDSPFSSARGDLFPPERSYGHTGFTGTSIWIDPDTETVVIFLSSRVHPDGEGNVVALRGRVATLAAAAVTLAR